MRSAISLFKSFQHDTLCTNMRFWVSLCASFLCFMGSGCSTTQAQQRADKQKQKDLTNGLGELSLSELSTVLIAIGLKDSDTKTLKSFRSEIPELAEDSVQEYSDAVERRMSTMLNARFTEPERNLLRAHGQLLRSFELLRDKKFNDAQKSVTALMREPGLSSQMYRWGLTAYAIADTQILEVSRAESNGSKADVKSENTALQFQEFQGLQCKSLCDTQGWAILARDDSASLTPQGYANRILAGLQFRLVNLDRPVWLAETLGEKKPTPKLSKEHVVDEADVGHLRALMATNKVGEAARIARKIQPPQDLPGCFPEFVYGQYVLGQASRGAQDRNKFYAFQKVLIARLEEHRCTEKDFGMDVEQFQSFYLDAKIWLARLEWEQKRLPESIVSSRQALVYAQKTEQWELFAEASQVLVGRAGFEAFTPQQNLVQTAELKKYFTKFDSSEFENWVQSREALFLFLDGKFPESAKLFNDMIAKTEDLSIKSFAHYWLGRALKAQKLEGPAQASFQESGRVDPLSIYDIFSGQILASKSGRASSSLTSPFRSPWYEEADRWITLKNERPFLLFQPNTWFARSALESSTGPNTSSTPSNTNPVVQSFESTLSSALLLSTFVRAAGAFRSFEEYSHYLRDSGSLTSRILKSEVSWLRQSASGKYTRDNPPPARSAKIAWLLYVTGDYVNAILFVGSLRNTAEFDTDSNSFLYFIFYPRPYSAQYTQAANKCGVDPDLLYAISRQESLFVANARSGVGAVGLMQLLPTTAKCVLNSLEEYKDKPIDLTDVATNTVAGACYVKELLKRYNGNLTFTIAAYNAGEGAVDQWVLGRNKIKDMPFFIEFIPYSETKKYVQRVLRNYYNMKWIYSNPQQTAEIPNQDWLLPIYDHLQP